MEAVSPQIFFILGRPRSGTTLLRTLLDAHPEIKVPPEYPVLLNLYKEFGKCKIFSPELKKRFFEAFKERLASQNWQYSYLEINETSLLRDLEALPESSSFGDVFKLFYLHYTSIFPHKQAIKAIGDKNPIFATYGWRLKRIFPDARFIYIVRDYRDNFLSVRKFSFEAPVVALQAYRWKYVVRKALDFKLQYPDQTLIIRYEDLVDNPEMVLRQVLTFLGMKWDSQMLDYYKYVEVVKEKYDKELLELFHKNLGNPVNKSTIGQWKISLSKKEIQMADFVIGEWAVKMRYERVFNKRNPGLFFRSAMWQIYGWMLYKIMDAIEFLPAGMKKRFALFLPFLAKGFHRIKRKKK